MKKKINLIVSIITYLLSASCLLMYLGGFFLTKYVDKKYKEKIFKINISIWLLLYIILLSTLTLFDDYFYRGNFNILNWDNEIFKNYLSNSLNLVPFKTIISYVTKFVSGNIAPYIFIYNILGNVIALMPFAFFLPLLFKKQNNFKTFLLTMICIVTGIELLQFITMSGSCDIDDVILNVSGSLIMYEILHIKSINELLKNIFLLEKNKINYKDLFRKIIIIVIPIILVIGVVLISEKNYINKNNQPFTHLKIIDKVKEENIACAEALEQFYEDKEFIYYFPCIKSKNVIVIYSNGYQETVATSLEYGDITIEDLERNNIEFIKHKKDM